jgi:hypothetical protein
MPVSFPGTLPHKQVLPQYLDSLSAVPSVIGGGIVLGEQLSADGGRR